jgi:lipoprotein-anchoring transpeptidase ErfK/SrfK
MELSTIHLPQSSSISDRGSAFYVPYTWYLISPLLLNIVEQKYWIRQPTSVHICVKFLGQIFVSKNKANVDLRHSLQILLGAIMLLISVTSQATAQPANRENGTQPDERSPSSPESLPPYPAFLDELLDLPPIQPILPEVSETRLVLKLGERRVYVYQGNTLKVRYSVAVGREGWETPIGQFKITAMVKNPGWTNPFTGEVVAFGPDSPLGDRWMQFWTDGDNVIGFHGTPSRESVGQAASHGCVRMYNEDVRELYALVQLGTPVTVEP